MIRRMSSTRAADRDGIPRCPRSTLPPQNALFGECFAPLGLRRAQFHRLLREAVFEVVPSEIAEVGTKMETEMQAPGDGKILCVQGEPLLDVFVPIKGTVDVRSPYAKRLRASQISLALGKCNTTCCSSLSEHPSLAICRSAPHRLRSPCNQTQPHALLRLWLMGSPLLLCHHTG